MKSGIGHSEISQVSVTRLQSKNRSVTAKRLNGETCRTHQ